MGTESPYLKKQGKMSALQQEVREMLRQQLLTWDLAAANHQALEDVRI